MQENRCLPPQLVAWYRSFLNDGKSAAFVSLVSSRYTLATLQRLSIAVDREVRRASVLALGMLGDRESIRAVGECMRDRDRCVRLVAEVAFLDLLRREFGAFAAARLDAGKRHAEGDRLIEARDCFESILAEWPDFAEAWYQLGLVEFQLEKLGTARKCARHAIRLNRLHYAAHTLNGRCAVRMEQVDMALRSFRRSLAINPSQMLVQSFIEMLLREGRHANPDEGGLNN